MTDAPTPEDDGPRDLAGLRGPRRILVAYDGSPPSDVAVELVAGMGLEDGSVVRLVEAIDLGPGLISGPWPSLAMSNPDDLDAALRVEARTEVEAARERLLAPGRSVTATVESGRVASVILDEARALSADLVVLGHRGHGRVASMLLGSVSAEVIDHAPCPVLIARGPRIDRVVLAWDGSSYATPAAQAVRTWPMLAGAEVRVVTVADISMPWWTGFAEVSGSAGGEQTQVFATTAHAAREGATRLAEDLAGELRAIGRSAIAERRDGDAATEIIAAAVDGAADLIVMGTHGRTGLARLTLGSVASTVTRHAPCSVLVVRASNPAGVARPA